MTITCDVKTQEKHLHVNFTRDIETRQKHLQLKITCEVQAKQWDLHVEINGEVKSKQWRLHVIVTCEVETKQWLEIIKSIVHVITCLHLYLILVIISGGGNASDYWRQGGIWVWEKMLHYLWKTFNYKFIWVRQGKFS